MTKKRKQKPSFSLLPTILFIGAVVLSGIYMLIYPSAPQSSARQATMLLITSDALTRKFEGETIENMTLLEALIASAQGGKLDVVYTVDSDNTPLVTSINGITNSQLQRWHFYLNGQYIKYKDIASTTIQSRDVIEVRYN